MNLDTPRAPALINLWPKSRFGPGDEDRAIRAGLRAVRGLDCTLPVLYKGRVAGYVRGSSRSTDVWCSVGNLDTLINTITINGNTLSQPFAKVHTGATGLSLTQWWDFFPCGTNPGAYTGTALTARQLTDADDGALPHGGNVSPAVKVMTTGWVLDGNESLTLLIYDRVLTYEGCTVTGALQNMVNTLPALRYINAGQPGLQIMATTQTAFGAGNNLSALVYVDQNGSPQSIPTSTALTLSTTAPTPSTIQASEVALRYAGGSSNDVLFLPLAAGSSGVQSITSFTTSGSTTGSICFALVHPIAIMYTQAINFGNQYDFVRQTPALDQIFDGACLNFIVQTTTGSAFPVFNGALDFAWA